MSVLEIYCANYAREYVVKTIGQFQCPVVSSSEWRVRVDWTIEDTSLPQVGGDASFLSNRNKFI